MTLLLRSCLPLLLAPMLLAEGQPALDADLPEPFDASSADALLTHSPFTRIVNLEETLQLTGVAYVEGRPVATFINTVTKEHLTVSEEPNAQGWKITEATPGAGLQDTEVRVMIGAEEITMHYGSAQLTPGGSNKGSPAAYVAGSGSSGSRGSDGHIKTSSLLGANGKQLYTSLSSDARDKLREIVRSHIERHPGDSMDQHSAYAQKVYSKIKAAEPKSTGAAPAPGMKSSNKSPKPNKPRQSSSSIAAMD